MAKSSKFARMANTKSVLYPTKEPKKLKKVKIPVQDIDLLDMYETIDRVPEEKKKEYIQLLLAQ